MIESWPLYWPEGRPRTPQHARERARFDMSFARARDEVSRQVEFMTGKYSYQVKEAALIISTNLPLRRDGLPLASAKAPNDPGVAVYFNYRKKQVCFACDRWLRIEDNMQAIAKTIDALRGISRWGTGDMMEAAFRGFAALPSSVTRSWRDVIGVGENERDLAIVRGFYRSQASRLHPDRGGSDAAMSELNAAMRQAEQELGK